MRGARLVMLAVALALVALAAGCASSLVVNQWSNPEYAAPHFNRIMVIGITKQPSIRRTFEDEFVARLKEKGVDAVPSYQFLPEDGPVALYRRRARALLAAPPPEDWDGVFVADTK